MQRNSDDKKQDILSKISEQARKGLVWSENIGVQCPNKNCISAQPREPTRKRFRLVKSEPITLQCYYCGRYIDQSSILI